MVTEPLGERHTHTHVVARPGLCVCVVCVCVCVCVCVVWDAFIVPNKSRPQSKVKSVCVSCVCRVCVILGNQIMTRLCKQECKTPKFRYVT